MWLNQRLAKELQYGILESFGTFHFVLLRSMCICIKSTLPLDCQGGGWHNLYVPPALKTDNKWLKPPRESSHPSSFWVRTLWCIFSGGHGHKTQISTGFLSQLVKIREKVWLIYNSVRVRVLEEGFMQEVILRMGLLNRFRGKNRFWGHMLSFQKNERSEIGRMYLRQSKETYLD